MSACHNACKAGKNETKHNGVVLKVGVVDQDSGGLHKDGYESYGAFPF